MRAIAWCRQLTGFDGLSMTKKCELPHSRTGQQSYNGWRSARGIYETLAAAIWDTYQTLPFLFLLAGYMFVVL